MSFNPPPFPAAGATFQYGNIIWLFDGTAGVWNILDGNLVGERGPEGPPGPQGDRGPTGNTGNPSTGDSASIIVSNGFITARLGAVGVTGVLGVSNRFSVVNGIATPLPASNGASGIASFSSSSFNVSSTGHVTLTGTLFNVRDEVGASDGVAYLENLTITGGRGIDFLRQSKNTYAIRGVTATNGIPGSASFQSDHFTVSSTGHVSLASTVTGDTVRAGTAIGITKSGNDATINNIGVTGIAVGDTEVGLTGRVQITAGANVTITTSGNRITIGSSAVGGAAGITASPQQVLFSSGNGGTGSSNFVFNGLAATFGGANTQFTITGPTFTIGNNTVVRGGIFYDAAESAPYTDFDNSDISIKASNGSVQRVRVNRTTTATYSVSFDESVTGNWTDTPGVAESVVVILQSANGKTGGFGSGILLPSASTILGGVTGGIDVFTMMRIPYSGGSLKMAFPIARGMTAPNFSIGT